MKIFFKNKKFIILISIAVFFITAGVFTIWAVTNRGAASVGWWKFDEGQGSSAYDASGNANTGTIANATWKQEDECKFGKCLYFDGTGDSVSVTSVSELNPTDGVTVEGWVKPNSFGSDTTSRAMVYKSSQYRLDLNQGMPRFMAYANSRWYSVQDQTADSAALFHETYDGGLYEASNSFTPAFGYRALTPTNLTAKKGVLITQSDNLQYSRGSQATPDGTNVVYENFNPNQGTLEFWVKPNWNGNDGVNYYIIDVRNTDSQRIRFFKNSLNNWSLEINGTYAAGSAASVVAGTWYHLIATWDTTKLLPDGSYYLRTWLNGAALANSASDPTNASAAGSVINIGSDYAVAYKFNGTIAGRILNRPLSSTEVTALYASGAGSTDSWVCGSDCVWMGNYSD